MEGEQKKVALQTELAYYNAHREEWLESFVGKFLLIKGEELVDVFSTLEDAYKDGVRRFGNESFFIRKLSETDVTNQIPSLMLGIINANL